MLELGVKEGDNLYIRTTSRGDFLLSPVDPLTASQLKSAEKVMDENWEELQAMADG